MAEVDDKVAAYVKKHFPENYTMALLAGQQPIPLVASFLAARTLTTAGSSRQATLYTPTAPSSTRYAPCPTSP